MAMAEKQIFVSAVFVLLLVVFSSASHHHAGNEEDEEADRISSLPGQPNVSFQQFSGYVTVNKVVGRALFYWLTEAVHDPLSKPLVVWLNGGPGCSSVAYGASEEIGPFRINKTASGLYLNKFSWNSVANLLFLETPAGVGFSYSNRSSDLFDTGDIRTATDSLEFLVGWMNRFPRYKNREVYLTGESYAGHYVPQLARAIIMYNKRSKHPINLKGFMVGNAVTDNYYDNLGTVTYWWSHAMISDKTFQQLVNTCDFRRQKASDECESLYSYAMDQEFGNIDQPDVQKELHANVTKIPYKWTACSEVLNRNWNDTDVSVLPIYREMLASGLRIWVFSGDVDSVVPVTATRYSLAELKLATKIPWYPWYVKKQVGGWTEVYEGLTFATVRGAGHEVPLFKPRAALQLFKSFLKGDPLPKS
ncbi:SERINE CARBOXYPEPTIDASE-LIKE 25 [Salix koriyanagi]|uniref:Carboxypeptidase n=1 Tax=Salix koriyanagi TaxID=2511006 RepID=A0A9Q0VSU4_9ROSI|nr:SERINE CARBOXYPEPTIDASE-LIKE 25 [Salix koriyanagi]